MSQRVYFLVHGTVQGVNFRNFSQKKATDLGVTGWVRNTNNDKVEGEAQGPPDAIKKFLKHIDDGPTHARVVKLDKEERDVQGGESQFEVR
ncbi:putative Acylphosphatase-like domain-containing protein [Seiridium unicorne]|uniref:acylphosphatase n=1 Tax=Seiridium unicorne TaxID=138068 RepID=A0ABR2V400_9PEZI